MLKRIWSQRMLLVFLVPGAAALVAFNYIPMAGILIAFQDYKPQTGLFGSTFVGMQNFRSFLEDPEFHSALRNTLGIGILSLLFAFPAPIILALMIDNVRAKAFRRMTQTITYMPHFLSWVIIAGLVYRLLAEDGIANTILAWFGVSPVSFMRSPELYWPIFIIVSILKEAGWGSIIYLAAITSIDPELYNAASIDGASKWSKMRWITLPGIAPTIALMFVLNLGSIVNVGFEAAFNLMNPLVMSTADVVDTYVYRTGILLGRFSYSTAVGFCQSVISFVLFFIGLRLAKKFFNYSII